MEPRPRLLHEQISRSIIGCFYEVYNTLGFGFREHLYSLALERELRARGHKVARAKYGSSCTTKAKFLAANALMWVL